jgi:hypothetical protein
MKTGFVSGVWFLSQKTTKLKQELPDILCRWMINRAGVNPVTAPRNISA